MNKLRWLWQFAVVFAVLACGMGLATCQPDLARADEKTRAETALVDPQSDQGLVIENDSELPEGYPHRHYELRFRVRGGVAALHWKVEKGALPAGMKLEDNGLLRGEPAQAGEFQFTVSVTEGGNRESAVQKGFVLHVISALALNWKDAAHVNGNRIEGSVTVSNTTPDDMDLTFIVLAVAGNGRATAIGYQHFLLARGTIAKELPFGDTLPHGGYVVHVDAVGEVAQKDLTYHERMQTPRPLHVMVGP
ncbi:MAG: putative Ig domain-containing protein [Candidatus Sulfotelmatobacter sp.]